MSCSLSVVRDHFLLSLVFITVFTLSHCLWVLKRPERRIHGFEAPQGVLNSISFLPWTLLSILKGAWMLGSLCPGHHDTGLPSLPAWELLQKPCQPPVCEAAAEPCFCCPGTVLTFCSGPSSDNWAPCRGERSAWVRGCWCLLNRYVNDQ